MLGAEESEAVGMIGGLSRRILRDYRDEIGDGAGSQDRLIDPLR
jgi:hypothetical protein